ncbi:MarR family winged helix-turn-helix transcriptional regulator [Actinomadura sp. SCN-SB]|uniref:MarR family winged helix-turn-helix transcriptional regulator n=1 Tax=Actinomadura sp. SCN-SB TaxID=3373092 RepID=UPI0037508550
MTTSSTSIHAEESTLWRDMLRAQVQISRRLQADMTTRHSLALGAFDVLVRLGETPGGKLRMNDLADRVLLSRSGLTRLIDRMQRGGLVQRVACDSDARGFYAVLTPEGRRRLDEATPTYREGIRRHVLGRLDEEERETFARILGKLGDPASPG